MTGTSPEICMRVPLSGGRFCIIIFSGTSPADFAPLHELNGARMSQLTAPLFLKTLKENGAGAPLLHSAPTSSQEWRKSSPSGDFLGPKKTTLQEDLIGTREVLAEKAGEMAGLDAKLAPVRLDERDIRDSILATHGRQNGVIYLNLDRAGERAGLFARLTEISRKWGPLKSQRARLNGEVKALERQIERLQNQISAESRKKRKA